VRPGGPNDIRLCADPARGELRIRVSIVADGARPPVRLAQSMDDLEQHWSRALDRAASALEAVACAHALPKDELGARRRRLGLEVAWAAGVDWARFGPAVEAPSLELPGRARILRGPARRRGPARWWPEKPRPRRARRRTAR
jgi:hypothetical protein